MLQYQCCNNASQQPGIVSTVMAGVQVQTCSALNNSVIEPVFIWRNCLMDLLEMKMRVYGGRFFH